MHIVVIRLRLLKEGDRVTFDIETGGKKPSAKNVTVI
ncbi:MAG: cold shock domain-containing protein [Desulfobacterales bacterium]|nr:cold shock domain-containing protein [Desulfobacterales bacterium]